MMEKIRTINNQHQMTTISKWWYSSRVLVYNFPRGMCCTPSARCRREEKGF